jgi:glutamate mutase epsilon subunit
MAPEAAKNNLRLERMEQKIDKLSEAVVALARVEEKILNLEHTNAALMKQLITIDERMGRTEESIVGIRLDRVSDASTLQGLRKFFWLLVSAILGGGFVVWFTLLGSKK